MSGDKLSYPFRISFRELSQRPANGFLNKEFFGFSMGENIPGKKVFVGVLIIFQLINDGTSVEPHVI